MAFSFDLGLAISAERYGAISAGPEHNQKEMSFLHVRQGVWAPLSPAVKKVFNQLFVTKCTQNGALHPLSFLQCTSIRIFTEKCSHDKLLALIYH